MKVFLAISLLAATAHGADVVALGVGASKANEVIVRIAGQATNVRLEGVPDASDAARSFLQCLVAGRVVRVDVAHGKVTLLDGNTANDHVLEYLQTKTQIDPCSLGKAAYVHGAATATTPVATTPAASPADIEPVVTSEQLPQPAKKATPPKKKKKNSRG
jgi:hypothetical protein